MQVLDEVVLANAQAQVRLLQLAQIEQVTDQARELHAAALHGGQRRALGLGDGAMREIARNGFAASFLPEPQRTAALAAFDRMSLPRA